MLIGAGFFSAQVKYVKWKDVCAFAGDVTTVRKTHLNTQK